MGNTQFSDAFSDGTLGSRRLFGVSLATGSTRLAQLAGMIGYDLVWIDVEHGAVSNAAVESLCLACEAGGAMPAVRIASGTREQVLWAAEAGARLIIVPMINTVDEAKRVVEYGKFPPVGRRGFNTRSSGVNFGLAGSDEEFRRANDRTLLIAQIETVMAVENLEQICNVAGLSGILVGPGDLSQDMGISGQFNHPSLLQAVTRCIRLARGNGKHAGIFASSSELLDASFAAGCEFAFVSIDIAELADVWTKRLSNLSGRHNPS